MKTTRTRPMWRWTLTAALLACAACASDADPAGVDPGGDVAGNDTHGGVGDSSDDVDPGTTDTDPGTTDTGTTDTDPGTTDTAVDAAGDADPGLDAPLPDTTEDVQDTEDTGPGVDTAPDTTDDATPDAAPDTADDVQLPDLKQGQFTLVDFMTNAPLPGAALTVGDQTVVSDAAGEATVEVETWAPYHIVGTLDGYHDNHWFGQSDDEGFSGTHLLVSHATSAMLSAALGVPLDPNKGIVYVGVSKQSAIDGKLSGLAGATVSLDAPYDVALVADASSPVGLSPGNTTLPGSSAWVIFVNVAAGPVHPTVTTPGDHACTVFPGEEEAIEIGSYGAAISRMSWVCESPAIDATITIGDFGDGNKAIPGVALSAGGPIVTTTANGQGTVQVDSWAPFHIVAETDGFHDTHFYGVADDLGFSSKRLAVSHTTTAMVAGALGIPLDPDKGFVIVSVTRKLALTDDVLSFAGATVDLDVPYSVALVMDSSSPVGFSVGNTTLQGSGATVVFVNVPQGPVQPTVKAPTGSTCTVFPGSTGNMGVAAHGDAVSHVDYRCITQAAGGTFTLTDYATKAPVPDADLSTPTQTVTTDADGKAQVDVETWYPYHVTSTKVGYHDNHWYGHNDEGGFSGSYEVVSHATTAMLAAALGIPLDPNKGFVFVSAFEQSPDGLLDHLAGATIDLVDTTYDVALVIDAQSPVGLSPGKTTLPSSQATVIFVNVAAGGAGVSITPPDGQSCTWYPGQLPATSTTITTFPDAVSRTTFVCTP